MTLDPIDLRSFDPVEPLSEVPDTWRQTFTNKYAACPRDAYLYLRFNGGALTHPLAGGTILHRAIERYIRHLLENDERTGDPETAKDILNEVLAESTDLSVSPERFDSMRSMAYHLAEGLVIPNSEDKARVVCLETPVRVEIGGKIITSTIDFAEADGHEVRIRDWKSSYLNAMRPDDNEDSDEYVPTKAEWGGTAQLILYGYALATGQIEGAPDGFNFANAQTFRLREDHPRIFWAGEGVMAYREAVISRETLLDWKLYLESLVEKMKRSFDEWQFPAIPGSHCAFCVASGECPIPAVARQYRGELRTDADAQRAALLWRQTGMRRDEYWDRIKDYMKTRGGRLRFGRDEELFFKPVESERFRRKVELHGRKIPGREALHEAIRLRNEGVPGELDLDLYYEKTTSSRLSTRKLTDAEVADEKRNGDIT